MKNNSQETSSDNGSHTVFDCIICMYIHSVLFNDFLAEER